MTGLIMFTVYERPRDYPQGYVVRRWECLPEGPRALEAHPYKSLDEARGSIPEGYYRLERMPDDDPCIVEVWL